jgi:hypothetical protein
VAVIVVELVTVKVAALGPKSTALALVNAVPVRVTMVPPALVPEFGVKLPTVGADGGGPLVMATFWT